MFSKCASLPLFALTLFFVSCPVGIAAQENNVSADLFPVRVEGKTGFINVKGELVIEPIFEKAYPFSEGLAAVQVQGKWGFINESGEIAIEPQFSGIGFFSEGLVSFQNEFTKPWGYLNKKGKVVIEPKFDWAQKHFDGVARVGLVTFKGKLMSRIADVGTEMNYRFIDKKGIYVENPGPTYGATGEAGEMIPFSKESNFGFVDSQGKVQIEPQFVHAFPFHDGLACVRKEELYGYINKSGKFVIEPKFQYPANFSEGLAGVPLGEGGWGFIDTKGKVVIPAKYGWVYSEFRSGLAQVAFEGKLGYINKTGDWVWKPSE